MRKKELDLYGSYRRRSRRQRRYSWCLAVLAALAAGLCVFGAVEGQNWALRREIAEVQGWMEATEEERLTAEIQWAYNEALLEREAAMAHLSASRATYPKVGSGLIARIAAVGGERVTMTLEGYDSATGVLRFRAESGKVIDIPGYVLDLRRTGLFERVDYTGYRYGRGVYSLDLSCVLSGGAS